MTCSSNLLSQISGWVWTKTTSTTGTDHPRSTTSSHSSKTKVSSFFDIRAFVEESKSNDDTTAVANTYQYVRNAFQCSTGKDILQCAPARKGRGGVDDATTMSDSHNDDDEDDDMDDDDDQYEYDQQMRRLASWGTFGTIGTTDSLDTNPILIDYNNSNNNNNTVLYTIDDDGRPIDPQIIEKAKQRNRAKLQQKHSQAGDHNKTKSTIGTTPPKRSVKFAYPPITSLKQCPRIDPEELDILFFSDEELATYEHDRRSTGVVDDVEIVAISTSFSDHDNTNTAPSTSPEANTHEKDTTPSTPSHSTTISNHPTNSSHPPTPVTTPKTSFRFKSLMMSSPRTLLRNSNQQQPSPNIAITGRPATPNLKRRNSFGSSISSSLGKGNTSSTNNNNNSSMSSRCSATDENSSSLPGTSPSTHHDPMTNTAATVNNNTSGTTPEQPKRLLKSVQIFLRERSTAYA
jgi:hypothetical protein